MNKLNSCRFSNFDNGEVRERWLDTLSDDPVQDVNELVIETLRDAICDAAVFGFGQCKIEFTYNDGDYYTNRFDNFDDLKQYYKHMIGAI